jgi:hypothetical protein
MVPELSNIGCHGRNPWRIEGINPFLACIFDRERRKAKQRKSNFKIMPKNLFTFFLSHQTPGLEIHSKHLFFIFYNN